MERSVEIMVTLSGLQFNYDFLSYLTLQKLDIYTLQKQCCMLSFLILQWVHTWANGTGHSSIGERRTTFCQNMWDGSEVLLGMLGKMLRKLGKLNWSSLGT
jgi:hypothetical protein